MLDHHLLSGDTNVQDSKDCLPALIADLHTCASEHSKCGKAFESFWLPMRLLDIHSCKEEGTIRLVSREEVAVPAGYTTLSHVWGTHSFLTLKTTNIQRLSSGFSLSELPMSFRDAIEVTEKIGLKYIWIDSLW